MLAVKTLLRELIRKTGYRVSKGPTGRFQATDEALLRLKRAGFEPTMVIDGGANVGSWTKAARSVFPAAHYFLVEPQLACGPSLRALVSDVGNATLCQLAISAPGASQVEMVVDEPGSTGAFVAKGEPGVVGTACEASTLDQLLAAKLRKADRALLKLDLQGHELCALEGARRILMSVEVVLLEFQVYGVGGRPVPLLRDLVSWLSDANFELFDFAALSGRPRDQRLREGDAIFVRRDSALLSDTRWE